jgi:peroxisomal 3,2-trans-enoyl-CoA isomerase
MIPEGFKEECLLIYGMRKSHPGLLEVKFHQPKKRNAIGTIPERKLCELINEANNNDEVKAILVHGGRYFSSGNDLSIFNNPDPEESKIIANEGVNVVMVNLLLAYATSKKPIIHFVRGGAMGIAFTLSAHCTFLYCSPDAIFQTPFMKSCQSPEGTSTLLFPQQFGTRLANELLLTDKLLTAQEAVKTGFANGIIEDGFDKDSDWFDPNIIPVIPKLLDTDLVTLSNAMNEMNLSKNIPLIEEITKREGKQLVATWFHPEFP